MTAPRIVLIVLLVAVCVQMAYFYPQITRVVAAAEAVPSARAGKVASHFDATGVPNGQQTIAQFFGTYIAIVVVNAVLFFGVPVLLSRVPPEFVNLPNRDYWLAPARRAQTMARLNDRFNWLGVATVALIIVVMQSVLTANLSGDPRLTGYAVWIPLIAYLAFSIFWIVRLFASFARTP